MMLRWSILSLIPFVAGFSAITRDLNASDPQNITDPVNDGCIDQVIVTFDAPLSPGTARADDFEVVGYPIASASQGTNTVTLTLYASGYPDSDATPTVRFFPGTLAYSNGTKVFFGMEVQTTVAADGANPLVDIYYGGVLLKPGGFSVDHFTTAPAAANEVWLAFSERVNLGSLKLTLAPSPAPTPGGTAQTATPISGTLASTQFVKFSNFSSYLATSTNILDWWFGGVSLTSLVGTIDAASLPLQWRKVMSFGARAKLFVSYLARGVDISGSIIMNDAIASTVITTSASCNQGVSCVDGGEPAHFPCTGLAPPTPAVTAKSLDVDGDGQIDRIMFTTKTWRWDVDPSTPGTAGNEMTTITRLKSTAAFDNRTTLNNWVPTANINVANFSLGGLAFSNPQSGLGYFTVDVSGAPVGDTSALAGVLNYTGLLMTYTGNGISAVNVNVADGACPILLSVKASGNAPNVTLRFSEPVTTPTADQFTSFFGSVPNAAATFLNVTMVDSRTYIGILVTPLNYTNFGPTNRLKVSGKTSIGAGGCFRRNYVSLGALDPSTPLILNVTTRDANGNGKIDQFRVYFSKQIVAQTAQAADFKLGNYTGTVLATAVDGFYLDFNVTELGFYDGALTPQLQYNGTTLVDTTNLPVGLTTTTAIDGVAPVPIAARTWNNANPDRIDGINVTFSENFTGAVYTNFAFTGNPSGLTISGAVAILNTSGGGLTTGSTPSITYSGVTAADPAGNRILPFTFTGTTDGANPRCDSSGRTIDTNLNGKLDAVQLPCTELLSISLNTFTVSGYTVIAAGSFPSGVGIAGPCVILNVTENNVSDTGASPDIIYQTPATDLAGNPLSGGFPVPALDRIPPILLIVATRDNNADGKIDHIQLEFSENISAVNSTGYAVGGYTLNTGVSVSGSNLELAVSQLSTYDGGARPNVSYSGTVTVDGAGNSAQSFSDRTASDGVQPQILNVSTNGACKMDSVLVSTNEAISLSSVQINSFAIEGYTIVAAVSGAVSPYGFVLNVNPVAATVPDIPTPVVNYSAPLTVVDLANNTMPSYSKAALDKLPPCLQFCSGKVGRSTVIVNFTEQVFPTLTNSNFNFLNAGAATVVGVANLSATSYVLTASVNFSANEINFFANETKGQVHPVSIRDGAFNNATANCYILNDDFVPPTLLEARTLNTNGDFSIDTIELFFDDTIEDSTFNITAWSLSGGYVINGVSTGAQANDNSYLLQITGPLTPDTGATLTVTYTKPSVGGLTDRGRNFLNSTAKLSVDRASPMIVWANATILSSANGGNKLVLTFSEPVSNVTSILNFTYGDASLGSQGVASVVDGDGSDGEITLRLTGLAISDFAADGITSHLTDRATPPNPGAPNVTKLTRGDTTPPKISRALTQDLDHDGYIDQLRLEFDDSMQAASFSFSNFQLVGYSLVPPLTVNDTYAVVNVTEGAVRDAGATPALMYSGSITDLNNNYLANGTTNTSDGVAPFLLVCSSTVRRSVIDCNFSEPMASSAQANDFVLNGTIAGATITGFSTTGPVVTIHLSRNLTLLDFRGGGGNVDLVADTNLTDTSGNKGISRLAALINFDTTGPSILEARTRDTNCNGRIDAIELKWNEPIIDTSFIATQFTIAGFTINSANTGASDDDETVIFVVAEIASGSDADINNVELTYTQGNITDLSENLANSSQWNVTDGAGPALVAVGGNVDATAIVATFASPAFNVLVSDFTLVNFSTSAAGMQEADGSDSSVSIALQAPLRPVDFTRPGVLAAQVTDALPFLNRGCGLKPLTNPDHTAPNATSVTTGDSNGNLRLDRVVVLCNENIDEATLRPADFSVAGYMVTAVNVSVVPSNAINVWVTEKTENSTDGAVVPQVGYTKGTLTDRYGNLMENFSLKAVDGIRPAIVSAKVQEGGTSLTVVFSEPVTGSATTLAPADFRYTPATQTILTPFPDGDATDAALAVTLNLQKAVATGDKIEALATIHDAAGNNCSGPVNITILANPASPSPSDALSQEAIIGIAAGGGAVVLLVAAALSFVLCRKKCPTSGKKGVAFDQNQIMNEFDFGSSGGGSTEMAKSSSGASKLEP